MQLDLTDRIALVTGASSGLGLASARALLGEGARVVVSGSDTNRIHAAAESLGEPNRVGATVLDLTCEDHPAQAVAAVTEHFGAPPDVLVMSTGGPPSGRFEELTDAEWERGLDLVLRGVIRTVRACLPGMVAQKHGRIVVITSVAAREPIDGLLVSSALRSGVHGLINGLAREVGPNGITANAVMPGYTRTERLTELADRWATERNMTREAIFEEFAQTTPIGRICEPEELGAAVTFLCSGPAAAINGIALTVDGGGLRSI